MNVIFRADASLQMGTGHVMRCLTLAEALKAKGAECQFICREHTGNLIEHLRHKGYRVHVLAIASPVSILTAMDESPTRPQLAHAGWLGATQEQDALECASLIAELQPNWLIVDHYALDARWEIALQPHYRKLMVIDDLADRQHASDLLLDQTFGRDPKAYQPWVSASCSVLCGSQYALLRPEFSALREYSLKRREPPQLEHLLITMGGVDKDNATGNILIALKSSELPIGCRVTVVMGASAPWINDIRQKAAQLPWPTEVLVNVSDMAQLMANSDLAIGAAGSTSWERCCLGLPSLMVVLADNQRSIAKALQDTGASKIIGDSSSDVTIYELITELVSNTQNLGCMSDAARQVADGKGTARVVSYLFAKGHA
ncbi:UDP-2,4-diacetamido-2,4,6-trideoxy-beta-L-altropyranose hydrolase [Pseudomonas sp. BF-B-27]|uniref:UDP-2,4-diacetamido-2,4, 6-trideoxy-beta-L-altropyranose hydrolase n=1 Tax=Pseudomonas sp. BF-B-27 TaxID=2832354 RepID=UPI001CBAA901|nr:UDP-2,4-diacetamido-2,4,6-trideoxy-beta-L-altropyranose hydrolase [Pseudomonas sp. BF-B-27]